LIERNISAAFIKLRALSFGPLIKLAEVGDNLPLGMNFDVNPIKWTGRRSFAIDAVAIEGTPHAEAAFVARASELVFLRNPIRCASLMSTPRVKHVQTIRVAHNTDAMRLKKPSVNSNCKIKRAANAKEAARLVNRLRQTTPQKEEHTARKSDQGSDARRDDSESSCD
jgi:hypothetical protein